MATNIVSVKGVSKYFFDEGKKIYALDNISFDIEKGEVFGLLGPNGAGKSTLINVMLDFLLQDKGDVEIFGYDVHKNRDKIFTRINSISADTRFSWILTPVEILNFYAKIFGLNPDLRKERVKEMIKMFEIEDFMHKQYRWLSTGESSRLLLAKALLNEPELLLLDEPTLGLDPDISIKSRDFIKRINKEQGMTILLTSHYMNEVEQLCDRIAFINKGKIVDIGTVKSVKTKKFPNYEVIIKLKHMKDKTFLKERGFEIISNNTIKTAIPYEENISQLLNALNKKGFEIIDLETIKPNLEDYFVKMLSDEK